MWQTVDYKGNTVKWYEAELIEKISGIIKNVCRKCPVQCCDTRECEAQKIKDLIQKYTGE